MRVPQRHANEVTVASTIAMLLHLANENVSFGPFLEEEKSRDRVFQGFELLSDESQVWLECILSGWKRIR